MEIPTSVQEMIDKRTADLEGSIQEKVSSLIKQFEKGKLPFDFIDRLRGKDGWEFLGGPQEKGWNLFVDLISGTYDQLIQSELRTKCKDGPFASKFLQDQGKVDEYRAAAEARKEAKYAVTFEGNSARCISLTNIGPNVKPKLYKILVNFGLVEYCDFELGKSSKNDASYSCATQYTHASQSEKVLKTINKNARAKTSAFKVELDTESSLRPPSPILRLSSGPTGGTAKKVSDFETEEIASVFSLFTLQPPTVLHEKQQYAAEYDSLIITFHEAADAEAALSALQKPLSDSFSFELQYITQETKAEHVASWLKDGGSVGSLYYGGLRASLNDISDHQADERNSHLIVSGEHTDKMDAYTVMGDGSLNRCKDLMSYQVRYIFFQSLARDKARTMRENDAGEDCNWSEDPTLDFSVFRLKKNIDVYDRTGRVENTMVSPDYEPGSYLHLNPSEAPVKAVEPAPVKEEDEFDLAIDQDDDKGKDDRSVPPPPPALPPNPLLESINALRRGAAPVEEQRFTEKDVMKRQMAALAGGGGSGQPQDMSNMLMDLFAGKQQQQQTDAPAPSQEAPGAQGAAGLLQNLGGGMGSLLNLFGMGDQSNQAPAPTEQTPSAPAPAPAPVPTEAEGKSKPAQDDSRVKRGFKLFSAQRDDDKRRGDRREHRSDRDKHGASRREKDNNNRDREHKERDHRDRDHRERRGERADRGERSDRHDRGDRNDRDRDRDRKPREEKPDTAAEGPAPKSDTVEGPQAPRDAVSGRGFRDTKDKREKKDKKDKRERNDKDRRGDDRRPEREHRDRHHDRRDDHDRDRDNKDRRERRSDRDNKDKDKDRRRSDRHEEKRARDSDRPRRRDDKDKDKKEDKERKADKDPKPTSSPQKPTDTQPSKEEPTAAPAVNEAD